MNPEYRKAEALIAIGKPEQAAELLDQLPSRENPGPDFYRLRGRALRNAGRHFDAEVAFRDALAQNPQDAGLLADLATTLLGQRRLKEALPYAREAVTLRPDQAAFYCLVGVIAEALELDEEATAALEVARRLLPTDPEPHCLYGFLVLRNGKVEVAEVAFRQALALDPSRGEAMRGLARCVATRGAVGEARRLWLDALAISPTMRDPQLDPLLWLGHPLLAPLRGLAGLPPWLSLCTMAASGAVFWWAPGTMLAPLLLLSSAVPPMARMFLSRGRRE